MLNKTQAIKDFIIDARREIHRHPELGYQETNTAKFVSRHLNELNIPYKTGVAKTGLVAELSNGSGPTILVRADMDALPIQESTGLEYQSRNPGVMHACGHDSHTAMLLGAIKLLKDEEFSGTLRFIFQPAEEGNYDDPDGLSGAQRMITEGILNNVSAAIGLHQIPTMPTGTIAVTSGSVMAAADFFKITVSGKSTHAGVSPETGIDAVVIAAELITSFQTIVARQVGPKDTAVVSVCTIEGGRAANIIADQVNMTGTIRALNEPTRQVIHEIMRSKCRAFAEMYKTEILMDIYYGVPVTVNNHNISQIAAQAACSIFGSDNVKTDVSIMGGEDFAYIAEKVPSCFALLGTQITQGETFPLHSPKMVINEDALPLGTAYLALTALELLKKIA